ncbi:MAG TPA: antibiotic biosynthesis monooxygenase [Gammaproteobacteria bacterium]|nr:antibiotic biosynthesis monooxygenase [Gammaproteobacteria bacterium]
MKAGYTYVWELQAAPGKTADFKRAYGPDGTWVQFFRRAPGYIRSELYADCANPQRFITVDYWESEAACKAFRERYTHEFEDLDVSCEAFTVWEREIGKFTPIP